MTHRVVFSEQAEHRLDAIPRFMPKRSAAAVRARWSIENCRRCMLDTVFDEDRARDRRDDGPENRAVLRRLALDVLRAARFGIIIERKCKRAGCSDAFARSVLTQMR